MKNKNDFLLGTATAAYQVEGNNTNSDTWVMEHLKYGGYSEKSGEACDHYHTYPEDIKKISEAGLNAYRFSIEWSRIEPHDGIFDENEMNHYLDMIHVCRTYHIEPVVTLFHFTSPIWLISKGGWEADTAADDFQKYAAYLCEHLKGEDLKFICTINEANIGALISGYLKKMQNHDNAGHLQIGMNLDRTQEQKEKEKECYHAFGTKQAEVFTSPRSEHGMAIIYKAHKAAVDTIHHILPGVKAGLSLSLRDLQYIEGGKEQRDAQWSTDFIKYIPWIKNDDFFGLQNYTRAVFDKNGEMDPDKDAKLTQMNYEYYPEGLEHVIREIAKSYKGEILITENGIATSDDQERCRFIQTAFEGVKNCIKDGIPVKGYFYWSMLDNYEWQSGYSMQFGIMTCDRIKQIHSNKMSAYILGKCLDIL
jgi:beta-glucosidase